MKKVIAEALVLLCVLPSWFCEFQSGRDPLERGGLLQAGRDPLDRPTPPPEGAAGGPRLHGFLMLHPDALQFYAVVPRLGGEKGTELGWERRRGLHLPSKIAVEVAVQEASFAQTWKRPMVLDGIPIPSELPEAEVLRLQLEALHARVAALEATCLRLAQGNEDLLARLEALERDR